ncbi:MAG: winged helix-turn-helix domain-containing protein [bacterium]
MAKKIPELHYRSSRICRVLGNPTAYEIMKMLAKKSMNPTQIACEMKLSIPTISAVLRSLRQLDLVRYETAGNGKNYFIKEKKIQSVMRHIENLVSSIEKGKY